MTERELSIEEVNEVYEKISNLKIKPFKEEIEYKFGAIYYKLDDRQYRLIYTPDFDWFCDIIYEGNYE